MDLDELRRVFARKSDKQAQDEEVAEARRRKRRPIDRNKLLASKISSTLRPNMNQTITNRSWPPEDPNVSRRWAIDFAAELVYSSSDRRALAELEAELAPRFIPVYQETGGDMIVSDVVINMGQTHRGKRLSQCPTGYLNWMLTESFPACVVKLIEIIKAYEEGEDDE